MKVIGLTGGIGTGKSTASSYLAKLGFSVIDADKISREAVAAGSPLLEKLKETFGEEIMLPDGGLDRKALGAMVFSDNAKRKQLDGLMHGEILRIIRSRTEEERKSGKCEAVFIDAPLLETGLDRDCGQVWLITAADEIRIARVMARDGLTEKEVQARIDGQMSESEKRRRADILIENSGSPGELYRQLDEQLDKW